MHTCITVIRISNNGKMYIDMWDNCTTYFSDLSLRKDVTFRVELEVIKSRSCIV